MGEIADRMREAARRGNNDAPSEAWIEQVEELERALADAKDRERLTRAEALIEELAGALVGLQDRFYDVVYQETNGLGEYVEADKAKTTLASYEAWKGAQTSEVRTMTTLAEELPKQINRVREIQEQFKSLRSMPNVMVEPQIAMMEASIQAGIKAAAEGDTMAMLRACEDLKGYEA